MHVKLMSEYECCFPNWIDSEEMGSWSIEDVALRRRTERWNDLFLDNFADTGWRDDAVRQRYAEEGRRLRAALERHFGDTADVTYDDWPCRERA